MFKTFLIANEPEIVMYASTCGVDRILVDLEILGKLERQGHLNTVISNHTISDLLRIRPYVPKNSLMVRINPIFSHSQEEIEEVIAIGADIIMLPMFTSAEEVNCLINIVQKRAKICLLVETVGAVKSLEDYIFSEEIDEVHIGLNDLHLELGCKFMFELLVNGTVDEITEIIKKAKKPFGIGGIAQIGKGLLPAELILAEHIRLGSKSAILSRAFHENSKSLSELKTKIDLLEEVKKIKQTYQQYLSYSTNEIEKIHLETQSKIREIVSKTY